MCIFCQIVSGELPSYKVYEDEKTLAFLDITPVSPGHTLVVTKTHYQDLENIPETELVDLIKVVKKVSQLLKDKLGFVGYNVTNNNGVAAGQTISHLHFHIIPRHVGDGHGPWKHGQYQPDEAEEIIRKITS
ncbi:MAG: HIT family protein [Patescibacteria group bacterium]